MPSADLAFVRANLPAPPLRLLEIGAGGGELARGLAEAGYDVLAIDPQPSSENVRAVALLDLDALPASFDAALAVTSLHHVEPLEESIAHLSGLLSPGAPLLVDEFDVAAFDERAAGWWLQQRQALGTAPDKSPDQLVSEHRAHLHPLSRIVAALEPDFDVSAPLYGPYLYRWGLDESFRVPEEEAIARGDIPAVGARFIARRLPHR